MNVALRMIGADTITSLTQGVKNSNVANDLYAETRDKLLRITAWNFAMERKKLARDATAPKFGFNYKYALPSDWLRTVGVWDNENESGQLHYRMAGGFIEADTEEVWLLYVRRVTDPNLMTPLFRDALSAELAKQFAHPIAQSNTLFEQMKDEAGDALMKARSVDAIEDYPEEWAQGSWITERSR